MALTTPIIPTLPQSEIRVLEDQITELAAHIHAANYRLLTLIRQFDASAGWAEPGLRSCAHWLNWKCGIGLNAAREKVRVAHALGDLPKISASFSKGEISYSKVRAMTRVATPENEEFLLMIALHGTASHVERAVRQFRRAKRNEALEAENDRHERRRVVWHMDEDGCWVMHGRFTPEQGERIMKAVDAAMDEIAEEQKDVSAETSPEPDMDKPMPCPVEQRRADAFERVADGFLSGGSGTAHGGDRCTVNVHTDIDTLRANGEGAESNLERGGNVSAETSRRLACDCGVVPWWNESIRWRCSGWTWDAPTYLTRSLDSAVDPAGIAAARRRLSLPRLHGAQVRRRASHGALGRRRRDEARQPGHPVPASSPGRARRRFRRADGRRWAAGFLRSQGGRIPEAPETRFRGNVFALMTANRRAGVDVSAETCIPEWHGERMDDDLVVDQLFALSER